MAKQANPTNTKDIQNEIKNFITSFGINNEEVKQDADLAGKEFQGAFSFINQMSNLNDAPMSFVPEGKKQFVHEIINILTNISNDIKISSSSSGPFDYDKWGNMSENISQLSQKLDKFNADTDYNFIGAGEMRLLQKFSDRLSKLDMKIQSRELVEDARNLQQKTAPFEKEISGINEYQKRIANECEQFNIIPNQAKPLQGSADMIVNTANKKIDELPRQIYGAEIDLIMKKSKDISICANLLEDDMWETRSNQLKLEELNRKTEPSFKKLNNLLNDKKIPEQLRQDIFQVLNSEKQGAQSSLGENQKKVLDDKIQSAKSQYPEIVNLFNENKYNFRQIKETKDDIALGLKRIENKELLIQKSEQAKKYPNIKALFQKKEQIVNGEKDQNKINAMRNKLQAEMKQNLKGDKEASDLYDSIRKMKGDYEYSRQVSLDMKKFSDGLEVVNNMNNALANRGNMFQNVYQQVGRPKELNSADAVKEKLGKELDKFSKDLGMCKRAGHKDTPEFKAMTDALNEAKKNMNEESFKKLSEAADNYLEKKGTRNPFATKMRLHRIDMAKKISSFAKECGECAKIVDVAEGVTEKSKNALIYGSKVNGKSLVDDVSRNLNSKPEFKEKANERKNLLSEIAKRLSIPKQYMAATDTHQKKNSAPSIQGPQ